MIRVGVLLLLLLLVGPKAYAESQSAAEPASANFDAELAGEVYGAALAFMAPRILDPVAPPRLILWGLRGLTALDPSLMPDLRETTLALTLGGRVLLAEPVPPDADTQAWGRAAARLSDAAWQASPLIRRAGQDGVIQSFFDEIFNHLDPYSRYVPPDEATLDRALRSGTDGAGLVFVPGGGAIVVREAIQGGPAARAGIKAGDRIIAVNGRPTFAETPETVAGWIAGAAGSRLTITWRDKAGRQHTGNLDRATVPPETVYVHHLGSVLLIRITRFDASTAEHLRTAITEGRGGRRRPSGLVIDLRGNRGGLLRQAVEAADNLLPEGVVATTAGRDPRANRIWRSGGDEVAENTPVVVLVDGRTASAAEILAAAIADRGRGVVIGSSTLGKGLVQAITQLPDGGELFLTWSRVLAPLGWPIQGLGVFPQICTSLGRDDTDHELAALTDGTQPLAAALALHRQARAPLPLAQVLAIRGACPAAEGTDADLSVARYVIGHPTAYAAALLPVSPGP